MAENSKENENEDDNIGRDKYFMDMDSISYSSDENDEEDSKNTIPNVNNYLNLNLNNEVKTVIENPHINPDLSIINNRIEDNINVKDPSSEPSKSMSNNNISNKYFINSINDNNHASNVSKNIINHNMNNPNKLFNDANTNNKIDHIINEGKVEQISLSSSEEGNDDDIQIVTSEQFKKHFQEDRYGPQRTIGIINYDKNAQTTYDNYKEMMRKNRQKNQKEEDKILDAFFMDKDDSNNNAQKSKKENPKLNPKNNMNNKLNNKKSQNNKIHIKTKRFIPLQKEEYRTNVYFEKLLINRVEKQILTDIYNEYEIKSNFDQTYYYIDKIKQIITKKGVEEAIKFLNTIENLELRKRVIIESTYFFKEIIKEEVENAKVNNGELILIKLDDFHFEQSMKNNAPLSGKINHGNVFKRKGKSNIRFHPNFFMNNFKGNDINLGGYNSFMPNPYMFKGQKFGKKKKINDHSYD